jgi:hypothetical protein
LALGLAMLDRHNATMVVLKRYDICRSDIVLSINDTTNVSVTTG